MELKSVNNYIVSLDGVMAQHVKEEKEEDV